MFLVFETAKLPDHPEVARFLTMMGGEKMIQRIFIVVCALLLLGGFGCKKAPLTKAQIEDNIREAVFRYMFEHNASAMQQNAEVYFLAVGSRTDPSQDLMARFKGHTPRVKTVSAATHLGIGGIKDRATGAKGLLFNIREISWITDDEVIVTGGYFEGGVSSSENQYHVFFQDNEWVVTEAEMQWIS